MPIFSTKVLTYLRCIFRLFIGLLLTLTLVGCDFYSPSSQLEQIRQRGEIRVGTIYGPTSYYQRDDLAQGFDYELAQHYAEWLGVKLTIIPVNTTDELVTLLKKGKVDLAAAAIMVTQERRELFRFGPGFYQVSPKLVYRNGKPKPASLNDIKGKLVVAAGSTGEDLLKEMSKENPKLTWSTSHNADVEELLKQVVDGKIDYTVVQDTVLARTQRYYPELTEGLTLAQKQTVAWAMSKLPDDSLYASVIDFFGQRFMDGAIAKLDEKYFGHVQNFDFVDTRTFLQRAKSLLPKYQPLFQTHAKNIDWRLLAAISYQESHWDPQARSYTGVRGMMMLTEPTAKAMGVNDRLHPEESIKGGLSLSAADDGKGSRLGARGREGVVCSHRLQHRLRPYDGRAPSDQGTRQESRRLERRQGCAAAAAASTLASQGALRLCPRQRGAQLCQQRASVLPEPALAR